MTEREKEIEIEVLETVRRLLVDDSYSYDTVVSIMLKKGFQKDVAESVVFHVAKQNQAEILMRQKTDKNEEEKQFGFFTVSTMVVLGCILFGETNPELFLGLSFIGAVIAYFVEPKRPIVAVVCGFLSVYVSYFVYMWYFSNRTSFYKIELLIPMFIIMVIVFGVYLILNKIFYSQK
jgi:hypothetical protein